MNFLALVNRLRLECGVSGSDLGTVVGATGEMNRLKTWVAQAWYEVQTIDNDWDWMRQPFSFTTTTGQAEYTPTQAGITSFSHWKIDSCRCYPTASGIQAEMFLDAIDYDVWRNTYQFGTFRTTYTRPVAATITPAKNLALGPAPDATGYTIVGEYFTAPVMLSADGDTPAMPDRYHMLIVYLAMQSYAQFEAAPEVMSRGIEGYKKMLAKLRLDQQIDLQLGGALA